MDNIAAYIQELQINKCSENTVKNIEYFWNEKLKAYTKPLDQWTKDDINQCIISLMETYKESTVETYKKYIKQYFNWVGKGDIVKHIKIKTIDTPIVRAELPTVEDVNKMIESTASPFYKALISLLYESGARISEVLMIKVNDVKETDKGLLVHVHQTKTGKDKRPILCLQSGQYIRNLIMYGGLSESDYLFRSPDNPDKPIYPENARETIKRIARKAGINKRITPHIFRHAQATDMLVQGYQETIINKKLGWKPHSTVSARYKHCISDDVINATLEKNGIKTDSPIMLKDSIKQPDKLDIATQSKILSKLNEENEHLKERLDKRDAEIEEMKAMMVHLLDGHVGKIVGVNKDEKTISVAFDPKDPEYNDTEKAEHIIKLPGLKSLNKALKDTPGREKNREEMKVE